MTPPALTQAAEWIAKFRPIEEAWFAAGQAHDAVADKKGRGEATQADWDRTFQARSAAAREWDEWQKQGEPILHDAKRALMAIRAKQEQR